MLWLLTGGAVIWRQRGAHDDVDILMKTDSHVFITGASSGIGASLARLMAGKGCRVSAVARRRDKLEALQAECPNIMPIQADVSDHASVEKALHLAKAQNGQIDIAVLNAGIYQPVNAAAFELSVYHQHMAVNYTGILNCLDCLIPEMVARKAGHIAFMASVAGYRGLPRSAAYGPTKAAVQNLAESIYFDLAPLGIKIQLINPGFVETEATAVNDFIMPDLISSEMAANQLLDGLVSNQFEIAFPKRFVRKMKWLRLLPANSYLKLITKFTGHQRRG